VPALVVGIHLFFIALATVVVIMNVLQIPIIKYPITLQDQEMVAALVKATHTITQSMTDGGKIPTLSFLRSSAAMIKQRFYLRIVIGCSFISGILEFGQTILAAILTLCKSCSPGQEKSLA
jgi:hypothetical protein